MSVRKTFTSDYKVHRLLVGHLWFPWWQVFVITLVLALYAGSPVSAKKSDNHKGKSHLVTTAEWARRKSKSSECKLGGVRYALNATWSPNLGPPFGVWKCVTCTCTPIQKKRRIVAKVLCRNVKTECPPEPKCENPVIYPGQCCKVCPPNNEVIGGGTGLPDFMLHEEEEEDGRKEGRAEKDFAVLLNGRTSLSPMTTSRLATGRIFLRRGTLHFSFVVDRSTPPPTTVQFLREDGNILEELEAQPTPYEVNNGRLCGTWTRVPKEYRTILLKEKMWVSLLWGENEDPISGRVARYKGVSTEVFSSLLSPMHGDPPSASNHTLHAGGTAIISVSALSDSLHVSLVFNGIFRSYEDRNVSVVVELRSAARAVGTVRDTIVLKKVFSDVNEAQLLTTLGDTSLRLLTRGKVRMKVWSSAAPELGLEGDITSRATCNVFHSVLTSSPEGGMAEGGPYGAGWGLLYLSNDGEFEYQLRLEGLPSPVDQVLLQTATKRKVRNAEDVTHALAAGWVNGTYRKPTYRDLDALLRGRLLVSVLLKNGLGLEGAFEAVSVTEALRTLHPNLLTAPSAWNAATAWVAVDDDCVMHYDVRLAGLDPAGGFDPTWSLQLRENDTSWDPRLDLVNVTLEHVLSGREVAAHTTLLTKVSLSRLHNSVSFLDLSVSSSAVSFEPSVVLSGQLLNVKVPPLCLLESEGVGKGGKKPVGSVQVDAPPCKNLGCLDEGVKPIVSKKCIDNEKNVYEDGTTWKSPVNNCARCMCTLGLIKCEDEPCPKPTCSDAVLLPGQCCPSCQVVSGRMSERVCKLANDYHQIGAFWHPFLAPNGFDKCVTCYCNITRAMAPDLQCRRMACPRLDCLDSEASLMNGSCCHKCPPVTSSPRVSLAGTVKDMAGGGVGGVGVSDEQVVADILAKGGCIKRQTFSSQKFVHHNGDVWFPKLSPNGVQNCVSCSCKDGKISCTSLKCPRHNCARGDKKCRKRKEKFRKSKTHSGFNNSYHRKRKNRRKERKRRLG